MAAEKVGWEVRIYDPGPVLAVCPPDDSNYSRTVQTGESFDACAEIVLKALQRSKVLPK